MVFIIPRFQHYMELYKIFIRILKDLNCYQEYKENFRILPRYAICYTNYLECNSFNEYIQALIVNHKTDKKAFDYFINDSFDWHQTSQGFDYWSKINRQFRFIFEKSSGENFNSLEDHTVNVDDGVISLVKGYLKSQLINESIKNVDFNNF